MKIKIETRRSECQPKEEFQQCFGAKLKDILKAKGLSQTWLADKIGVTRSDICHFVNGRATPTLYHFYLICKCLGVEPNDLI